MTVAPAWNRLLGWAAAFLVFCAALSSRADADLWGHVRFGLDLLAAHRLTPTDPYSFTQDIPWVNHEWLSELQLGVAFAIAGPAGLQLLKASLLVGVAFFIWQSVKRASVGLLAALVPSVLVGTIHMWSTIRPQLWSFLCFAVVCRVIGSTDRRRGWLLPVVFVFWANCHGGWIVGLGALGLFSFATAVNAPTSWKHHAATVAACFAATLVNPYGWRLWEFMFRTVRVGRSIAEWEPLWHAPGLNWVPWILAVVVSLGAAVERTRRPWPALVTLAPLAYGAAKVQRLESLFVVGTVILLGPWLSARWPASAAAKLSSRSAAVSAFAASGLAIGAGIFIAVRVWGCIPLLGGWAPDSLTVQLLQGAQPERLVTFFDWGEYAIWHLGPKFKVSIDGRRETVYSDAVLAENDAIVAGAELGFAALADWKAGYVWLPARSIATKGWLATHGYRIDRDGATSFLAVRADLPRVAAQALPPPADCFPR